MTAPRLQVLRLTQDAVGAAASWGRRPGPSSFSRHTGSDLGGYGGAYPAHGRRRGSIWCLDRHTRERKLDRRFRHHATTEGVAPQDLEYQAVLGRGWLSPWIEGGKFCGSRGMALPLLGLNVRLKGEAAKTHECTYFCELR